MGKRYLFSILVLLAVGTVVFLVYKAPQKKVSQGDCEINEVTSVMNDQHLAGIIDQGAEIKLLENWYS
ncbi:MAG: hypothetical protein ABL958_08705, partial [Bdellovibrionia bacterium]